jgi:predicted nucleic acid-binding protein
MVENRLFIVDASVALKWFLRDREDHIEQAQLLKSLFLDRKIFLLVPAHFYAEFLNIYFRKNFGDALTALSHLKSFNIPFAQISLEVASVAGILMKKHLKISFYDACYHALAIHKEGTFVTADEQYYKAVKKEGHIVLLKNYK